MTAAKRRRDRGSGGLFKRGGRGNWIIEWTDETGRRRSRSSRTTEKAVARRILEEIVAEVAKVKAGLVSRADLDRRESGREDIRVHLETYIGVLGDRGMDEHHRRQKATQLQKFVDSTGIRVLDELSPDRLEAFLGRLKSAGRSARTQNSYRQQVLAFANWCKETDRLDSHRLARVPKRDESRDRRRVRRALTDEELVRLLRVARERGREAWYLTAVLAGLRKGDLKRLTWADVDLEGRRLRIRDGKGRAEDVLPMRPELARALQARYEEMRPAAGDRVFPQVVTDRTRQTDFLRAGLAREEVVLDANGEPVRNGKSPRAKVKTRIVTEDDQGRVIDLHALRTTFGTKLTREGVAPLLTKSLMRHASFQTTEVHYSDLGVDDTAAALDGVSFTLRCEMAPEKPSEEERQLMQQLDERLITLDRASQCLKAKDGTPAPEA
ncbi:site-specific integrase, partial [Planctomycetota bacterium]|nr:site-specific integrase [Planctomycetota bacterium]